MSDKDNTLKANESLLNGLHQIVAADLIDNDVTADIAFNTPLRQLEQEVTPVGELPFFDDEEDEDDSN